MAKEGFVAVLPKDHRMAQTDGLTVKDFAGEPMPDFRSELLWPRSEREAFSIPILFKTKSPHSSLPARSDFAIMLKRLARSDSRLASLASADNAV